MERLLRDDYKYSYSNTFINKVVNEKAKKRLPEGKDPYTYLVKNIGNIDELIGLISKGFAISPSHLKDNYRKKSNLIASGLWCGDVDNCQEIEGEKVYNPVLTIDRALEIPFIKDYCLLYTSPSHTPNHHRFRIILPLPQEVDPITYVVISQYMQEMTGGALDSTKFGSESLFYGNNKAIWYGQDTIKPLPHQWIEEIKAKAEKKKVEDEKEREKKELLRIENKKLLGDTSSSDIEKALNHIDCDDYDTWVKMGMALYNHFDGGNEGLTLFDSFSSQSAKYKGIKEVEAKWFSFQRGNIDNPITLGTLFYFAIEGGYTLPKTVKVKLTTHRVELQVQEYFNRCKFTPDMTLDQKYLWDDDEATNLELWNHYYHSPLPAINSPKSSGKSYFAKKLIIAQARKEGKKLISINARRSLGQAQATEWDITYIDDVTTTMELHFDKKGDLALCGDSLLKLKGIDTTGALVILDECEQICKHLLLADTAVKVHRSEILALFHNMIKQSSKVVLLDADLSDMTVKSMEDLTGHKAFKVKNLPRKHDTPCLVMNGDKSSLETQRQAMFKDLEDGKNLFIVIDSKKEQKAMYEQIVKQFPHKIAEVQCWNADSTDDPHFQSFKKAKDKTQYLKDIVANIVLVNGVLQSGISIDKGSHFHKVYGEFHGVMSPSDARQLLIRLRDLVDRHVWITNHPLRESDYRFNYEDILQEGIGEENYLLEHLNYVKYLKEQEIHGRENYHNLIQALTDFSPYDCPFRQLKAKIIARENLAFAAYREVFIEGLKREGYAVAMVSSDGVIEVKDRVIQGAMKERKKEIALSDAHDIATADPITYEDAVILSNNPIRSKEDNDRCAKAFLEHELPHVELTTPFILDHVVKGKWKEINATKRLWMTQNKEVAKRKDIKALNYQSSMALRSGIFWGGDLKPYSFYVELFEKLDLQFFIDCEDNFSHDHEAIISFAQKAKKFKKELSQCGVKGGKDTIKLLSSCLRLFGYTLKSEKKEKDKPRKYKIDCRIDPVLKEKIMSGYSEKYQDSPLPKLKFDDSGNLITENAKTLTEIDLSPPHFMPSLYKEEKQKVELLKPLPDKASEPPLQQKIDFSQKMNNSPQVMNNLLPINQEYSEGDRTLSPEVTPPQDTPETTPKNPKVGSTVNYQRYYPMNQQWCQATAKVKAIQKVGNELTYYLDNFMQVWEKDIISVS